MSENSNYKKLINSEEFKSNTGVFPVPFGELPNGKVLVQDMKSIPNMLVTGVSGCGKTMFVQSLLLALCEKHSPDDVKFFICDSKWVDYTVFNKLPFMYDSVISISPFSLDQVCSLLRWVTLEISSRIRHLHDSWEPREAPELFIVLDDCANVIMDKDCSEALSTILDRGKTVGIHLILVTSATTRTVATQYILATTKNKTK